MLLDQGLVESREQGKRLIMAGRVQMLVDGGLRPVAKPGQALARESVLKIEAGKRFVSRGGEKLLTALEHFQITVQGAVALDVGAATGGFTDCLLQHGAARVYCVDVGHGQLHWKLRKDPRVVNLEGVNFRAAQPDLLPEPVDLIVVDCSFISLRLILPACLQFLKAGGEIIALVKPQFEVGPKAVIKGVVRDPALREEAVANVIRFAEQELGLFSLGSVPAKILGPKGNQEYLVLLRAAPTACPISCYRAQGIEEHGRQSRVDLFSSAIANRLKY